MRPIILAATAIFLGFSFEAAAQYLPTGVQQSVPLSTVTGGGWTECWREDFSQNGTSNVNTVLANCPGERLMLACSPTGSNTLTLLAQAPRADVIFDTTSDQTTTHNANGVEWYFHADNKSWGFAPGGETVSKNSCDTASSSGNLRMCIHTGSGGEVEDGYRCGDDDDDLNGDPNWERILFASGASVVETAPTPVPVLPAWLALVLGGVILVFGIRKLRQS